MVNIWPLELHDIPQVPDTALLDSHDSDCRISLKMGTCCFLIYLPPLGTKMKYWTLLKNVLFRRQKKHMFCFLAFASRYC